MSDFNTLYDSSLQFQDDDDALTTSAAGTVDGVAKVITVGAGFFEGVMNFNVLSLAIDGNDELYQLRVQGSTESDFGDTIVDLATLELGAKEVLSGDQDSTAGVYNLPFTNEQNGTKYPYLRTYMTPAGTSISIDYEAYATTKRKVRR